MPDSPTHPIVIVVTGGVACGKSEVGSILVELGFEVCDADHVAHGLMTKGMPVFNETIASFGSDILGPDGQIDRGRLGQIVFADRGRLDELNRIVHPRVRSALQKWIAAQRSGGTRAAALVPLLYESGMDSLDWDAAICVSSDGGKVAERLKGRGIDEDGARLRIAAQMPLPEKERRADLVIENNGTLEALAETVRTAVAKLICERWEHER